MNSEITLRLRPFVRYLHLSYSLLYFGRVDDARFQMGYDGDRRYRERWQVMVDNLPLNTYLRAYQSTPMYGLKRENHTLWIRQRIGLDQFATTRAAEIGLTPTVPFFRASYMEGDPYVRNALKQKGFSYHGGLRGVSFGWNLNISGWSTQSDYQKIDMNAFGLGAKIFHFVLYGERNWRTVTAKDPNASPYEKSFVHPSSTISQYDIAWVYVRGLILGGVYETLIDEYRNSKRTSAYIKVNPITFVNFEYWLRSESGSRELDDSFFVLHLYADI